MKQAYYQICQKCAEEREVCAKCGHKEGIIERYVSLVLTNSSKYGARVVGFYPGGGPKAS